MVTKQKSINILPMQGSPHDSNFGKKNTVEERNNENKSIQ